MPGCKGIIDWEGEGEQIKVTTCLKGPEQDWLCFGGLGWWGKQDGDKTTSILLAFHYSFNGLFSSTTTSSNERAFFPLCLLRGIAAFFLRPPNALSPLCPYFTPLRKSEGTSFPTPRQLVKSVVREYNPKLLSSRRTKLWFALRFPKPLNPRLSFPSLAERCTPCHREIPQPARAIKIPPLQGFH